MPVVTLDRPDDFPGWRDRARHLAQAGVPPDEVRWRIQGEAADLLEADDAAPPPPGPPRELRASRRFMDLAELVACHRDADRFALLYRILVRLQDQPRLMEIDTDDDVFRLDRMARAVRRDIHKMTAFVRFKEVQTEDCPIYLAWFEPDHHIVDRATGFFVNRFATMRWTIITPERSVAWDGKAVTHGPGGTRADVPEEDATDEVWRTYYANIFNPARLHVDAMKREMPMKYWKNLPEARLIAPLIRSAGEKEAAMIAKAQAEAPKRAAIIVKRLEEVRERPYDPGENDPLRRLKHEAEACQLCPLYEHATQTVFGEGLPTADLVFVGEQPGDKEDLAGKPFIGPAGAMFNRALDEAGIDRRRAYVTNAVKHFKFEPRGKRRIHQKPGVGEINACRHWIEAEMQVLKPRLTIALGATAIRSLTGKTAPILSTRGQILPSLFAGPVFVTVHPSFLLRLPDEQSQKIEYGRFVADLKAARDIAAQEPERVG
ncbi:UdgX family uracil-DNA binding protein [Lichenihabitans sp. Uapishka_5]|uniref:UdgX family uracil-DNA binding protein n=1 Tax=Lichenihabitans sp. Uapishka_5 TaxID=3037302 RepID=UPI0029E81811|nr:UdgX family uracil-DNA binding protein [Lichenihabitans sp. Uapishka_5]MDX7953122.1 UdgX family uracil-DNA binding protein [Lichenihabitans sp. Uapishka_5]